MALCEDTLTPKSRMSASVKSSNSSTPSYSQKWDLYCSKSRVFNHWLISRCWFCPIFLWSGDSGVEVSLLFERHFDFNDSIEPNRVHGKSEMIKLCGYYITALYVKVHVCLFMYTWEDNDEPTGWAETGIKLHACVLDLYVDRLLIIQLRN